MVLVPPSLGEAARREGVRYAVGGEPPHSAVEAVWEKVRRSPPGGSGGIIDRELFARAGTEAMLPAARSLIAEWRPDAVVREPCEYASSVAACEARIPQVQVAISQSAIEYGVLEMVAPDLDRRAPGLSEAIRSAPYLTPFPPGLDHSPWPHTHRFRTREPAPRPLPDWWPGDDRPLVYVTFGTVAGHLPESGQLFPAALAAATRLPARALLTVGRHFDPASLEPTPSGVHVEQWVPQADVLAQADLVICHGGSGTILGALAAGVPLVACPLFADQRANAQMVSRAGAGVCLATGSGQIGRLGRADVDRLVRAVHQVLERPAFSTAAKAVAGEIGVLPPLDQALVGVLEGRTGA